MIIKLLVTGLTLLSALLFAAPKPVEALAKFNTTYQISYQVSDSGKTKVIFVINQKNNLSVVYATDFGISINETKIDNVKVLDEGVSITPEVVKSFNQTSISFPFANKVVGKDKNHAFSIEYETTDVATKLGNTWQINIPRLEPDENVSEQNVILTVPTGFPSPAYIDPKPDVVNGNIFYFSGGKVSNKSISAIFGKTQYYRGRITYHLAGNGLEKTVTEIALPPDTSYQTVYYQNLEPKPDSIRSDEDGNILARYTLEPRVKKDIVLDLLVKIDFQPKPTSAQPSDNLLVSNSIWNFENPIFSGPEIRNLKTPKAIYDFVSDKLKYDYEKLNKEPIRSPAAEALINNNSAICTDFTDVFVAIARRSGVYAREIEGYAISDNPDLKPLSLTRDVLHAWPEYFDKTKSTWVQIDPTWSNTTRGIDYFNKLDFNHIALAIHGLKADYPIPAGGYKNGTQSRDITFEPLESTVFPAPQFELTFLKQEGNELIFELKNITGVSYSGKVASEENDHIARTESWTYIPPFGTATFRANIKKAPLISKISTKAIININGTRYETGVSISSASSQAFLYSGIGGFLALAAVSTRYLHLRRRKQKASLYR